MCLGNSSSSPPGANASKRVLASAVVISTFFLLGVSVSFFGPSIPSLSRDVHVRETDFGGSISVRGLGNAIGCWVSAFRVGGDQEQCLQKLLNVRMYRLGVATIGMGVLAVVISYSSTLFWIGIAALVQGFASGVVGTAAISALNVLHGAEVAPWLQAMEFFLSLGALFTPAGIAKFGYRAAIAFFGVLVLPTGLGCFLVEANGWGHSDYDETAQSPEASEEASASSHRRQDVTLKKGGISYQAAADGENAELEAPDGVSSSQHDERLFIGYTHSDDKSHLAESAPARLPSVTQRGAVSTPSSGGEPRATHALSPQRIPAPSRTSEGGLGNSDSESRQLGEAEGYSGVLEGTEIKRLAPTKLVVLLATILFFYVGLEVGYGAWVTVVVLRDKLGSETQAVQLASVFWGGVTSGRLLAVPLSAYFTASTLFRMDVMGCVATSWLLLLTGRKTLRWAALGSGLFGLSLSSLYGLILSLPISWGYSASDRQVSLMVVCGAFGEMVGPMAISWLLDPDGLNWTGALYGVSAIVSTAMVVVYVASMKMAGSRA